MLKQITLKHFAGKGWPDLMMMEKAKRKTTKLYCFPRVIKCIVLSYQSKNDKGTGYSKERKSLKRQAVEMQTF